MVVEDELDIEQLRLASGINTSFLVQNILYSLNKYTDGIKLQYVLECEFLGNPNV